MKTIQECIDQLNEKQKILNWLIAGQYVHCIPIKYLHIITKEWICENYNVELSYFDL